METLPLGHNAESSPTEKELQPEALERKDKIQAADQEAAHILEDFLARVEEELAEHKTVSLQGREYPMVDEYDTRLAREQLLTGHLEARLEQEQEKEEPNYYLQKALGSLIEVSKWSEGLIVRSAELARTYPKSAELVLPDDEHRDTP